MSFSQPASAIIDGTLCRIDRLGQRSVAHTPMGSAVVEFLQGPLCTIVREHPYGLLPGMPNLYCLDADLRLRWLPAWPAAGDLCAAVLCIVGEVVTVRTFSGATIRFDLLDGRLLGWSQAEAVAG